MSEPRRYLCVPAEDHHSPVGTFLGQRLDGGVVVLHPRQTVPEAPQEGLLVDRTVNLHPRVLELVLVCRTKTGRDDGTTQEKRRRERILNQTTAERNILFPV